MVVWAHNGHIARAPFADTIVDMGSLLAKKYGSKYVSIGFVFGEGSFQALDWTTAKHGGLREFTLGAAPDTDVSTAFTRAGCEVCVVDLRTAPKGPVADWFAAAHPRRDTGAVFSSEEDMTTPGKLSELFDAVIYVHKTTRARPLAAGKR
jgi:erythromycin esterase